MTEPLIPDLVALATPYALHATTDDERADIELASQAANRSEREHAVATPIP